MTSITCKSKIYDNTTTIAGKGEMKYAILRFFVLSENIIYWLS